MDRILKDVKTKVEAKSEEAQLWAQKTKETLDLKSEEWLTHVKDTWESKSDEFIKNAKDTLFTKGMQEALDIITHIMGKNRLLSLVGTFLRAWLKREV